MTNANDDTVVRVESEQHGNYIGERIVMAFWMVGYFGLILVVVYDLMQMFFNP